MSDDHEKPAPQKKRRRIVFLLRTFSTVALWSIVLAILLTGSVIGSFFLVLFLAMGALREFYRIARARGVEPLYVSGMTLGALLILGMYLQEMNPTESVYSSLEVIIKAFGTCVLTGILIFRRDPPARLVETGVYTVFGLVYVVWLLGYLIKVVFLFDPTQAATGFYYVLYLIAITKFCDMGAYLVGTWIGKNPAFEWISPKKTLEGYGGAMLFAQIASVGGFLLAGNQLIGLNLPAAIILGVVIGIAAIIGDLVESIIKRGSNMKDSGGTLPGIGGFLDLIDSLLFTAPLLYFYLVFFVPDAVRTIY
jgi:phosphatidate cytidylyltransferase